MTESGDRPAAPEVVLNFSYDKNGFRTQMGTALGVTTDNTVDYMPDALDRLASITQTGSSVIAQGGRFQLQCSRAVRGDLALRRL